MNHKQLGSHGEAIAANFLESKGFRLVERNFRTRRGELDLVAESPDGVLVFIEVKSDLSGKAGRPEEWVTATKIRKLQRMAQVYCWMRNVTDREMRFDVVAVDFTVSPAGVLHFENAFIPESSGYF